MDFTALKTAIQNAIKLNGNEEITGDILQGVLLSMVSTLGDSAINDLVTAISNEATARQNGDSTLNGYIEALQGAVNSINTAIGNGFVYAGIATPATTPATGKVFYLALNAGTYTNFGNIEVSQGINILKYNGSTWSLDAFIGIDDAPTPSSNNLVKSGGVFDKVMADGSAFDISAHFASGGTLATYADLSAALTALNTLSAAYKKGGMSIKFVQSSDNKYVLYRLISNSFNIDPSNWVNMSLSDFRYSFSNDMFRNGTIASFSNLSRVILKNENRISREGHKQYILYIPTSVIGSSTATWAQIILAKEDNSIITYFNGGYDLTQGQDLFINLDLSASKWLGYDYIYLYFGNTDNQNIDVNLMDFSNILLVSASDNIAKTMLQLVKKTQDIDNNLFLKLNVGTWNVANWSLGQGNTDITDAQYEEKKTLYRNLLNGEGIDIICVQEYDPNFTVGGTHLAREAVFAQYKQFDFNAAVRPDYGYHCNAIGSNGLKLIKTETIMLAGSSTRHAYICVYEFNGKEICVMSLQSPWSRKHSTDPSTYPNVDNDTERAEGFAQVISYAASFDYAIICGDFNVYDVNEFDIFANAGFTMANHGYLGNIITAADSGIDSQQSLCIDNIICKGFAINKITIFGDDFRNQTAETQKIYSDHSGIMCEYIMTQN